MATEGSGATRAGDEDLCNEDSFLVEEGLGLYVVCDGAGIGPAGEVASREAVAALEEFVERAETQFGESLSRQLASQHFAGRAIGHAMEAVLRKGRSDPELSGMATTATMLLAHGRRGVIGHVGDSRAYLIRDGRIHQLTVDHEWTEQANGGGGSEANEIDTFSIALRPGDTYLLCTDGAERVVEDPVLVSRAEDLSPRLLASRIVSAAHRENPHQDATVVVVRVRGDSEPAWLWLSEEPRPTAFGHTVRVAA